MNRICDCIKGKDGIDENKLNMMILFWIILVCMTVLSMSFIVWPLIKKPSLEKNTDQQKNIFQQQLQELEVEFKSGVLDQVSYESARRELASSFLYDQKQVSNSTSQHSLSQNRLRWITSVSLGLFMPIFATAFYFQWGDSNQVEQWLSLQQHANEVHSIMEQIKSPEQLITRMQQTLAKNPNSAKGWFLLGRLYFSMNEYAKAANAFSKANNLKANEVGVMLQYAEALFLANDKELNLKAQSLIKQVLIKESGNPVALNLLALNAYQQKAYQKAIDYWEQVLQSYSANSQEGRSIMQAIAKAQRKLAVNSPKS